MKVEKGVLCVIIGGAIHPSPNLGKYVTVDEYRGEHSLHGPIWSCIGMGLITEYGVIGSRMDFAEDWLKPIKPESLKRNIEDEISV